MIDFLGGIAVAVLLFLAARLVKALRSTGAVPPPSQPPALSEGGRYSDPFTDRLYGLERRLREMGSPSIPSDLLADRTFIEMVEMLSSPSVSTETLMSYLAGEYLLPACAALGAMARRAPEPGVEERLLARINEFHPWNRFFSLRVLEAWHPEDAGLAGRVLLRLNASWGDGHLGPLLDGFLHRRATVAPPSLEGLDAADDVDADGLRDLLRKWVDPAIAQPLLAELDALAPPAAAEPSAEAEEPAEAEERAPARRSGAVGEAEAMRRIEELERRRSGDVKTLADLGRVTPPHAPKDEGLLGWPTADGALKRAIALLVASPPRSVLVVGEQGVGKTSLARRAAARLSAAGWTVFEASGGQVNSGMIYVGALENRVRSLLRLIRARGRTVWLVPDLQELMWAGRHDHRNVGLLEMLVPAIEAGELLLLAEARSAALERILTEQPEVARLFEVVRLEPPSEVETATLLDQWAAGTTGVEVPPAVRTEAAALARQYLQAESPPGGVLRLLKSALGLATLRDAGPAGGPRVLGTDDLVEALAQATGLPLDILDERCEFDAATVRRRFESKVIGQPEAVDCLVERLALLKAGVTDPGRPTGVFLFVGGSGTGKTMLARTLAEYLFGSPERLIRLDMSEMHGGQVIDRLLGDAHDPRSAGNSLVERVRRQPFSVVLLDEFDRAHPDVWDMFLQVFDAGRLTDRRGETADFRHAIIILTSNLGAATNEVRLGLVGGAEGMGPAALQRAVERTFRPEFLNRLDRVVFFRPLTREVMRRILHKMLADAFARRGLRRRDWAVELEDSAIDLLVEQGFSPTLGARPLKRELERLLLAPLAAAIVNRSAPEGNQFLFVRADGDRLAVQFVDPDAQVGSAAPPAGVAAPAGKDLAAILYEARGTADEVEVLHVALLELQDRVKAEAWASAKQALLLESAVPGFWERPERFERLGRAEYMDRVEGALRLAASLLERLRGDARAPRRAYPRDMVHRLAQQLYLLDVAAGEAMETGPRDAFVSVEPSHEDVTPAGATRDFARRVAGMYEAWARARGMRFTALAAPDAEGGSHLLAVSGFAAHRLLAPEAGLHVLEWDEPNGRNGRATVRVRIEPQPAAPARDGVAGLRRQAEEALAAAGPLPTTVVRRYREAPSPLVRDLVRCWRTGRIERVLGGDFDVIPVRE